MLCKNIWCNKYIYIAYKDIIAIYSILLKFINIWYIINIVSFNIYDRINIMQYKHSVILYTKYSIIRYII